MISYVVLNFWDRSESDWRTDGQNSALAYSTKSHGTETWKGRIRARKCLPWCAARMTDNGTVARQCRLSWVRQLLDHTHTYRLLYSRTSVNHIVHLRQHRHGYFFLLFFFFCCSTEIVVIVVVSLSRIQLGQEWPQQMVKDANSQDQQVTETLLSEWSWSSHPLLVRPGSRFQLQSWSSPCEMSICLRRVCRRGNGNPQ